MAEQPDGDLQADLPVQVPYSVFAVIIEKAVSRLPLRIRTGIWQKSD